MFLNDTFAVMVADAHRQSLLAQAEQHRLVKLARAARAARAGTRVTTSPPAPRRVHPVTAPADDETGNRRYAVSR